MSIVSDIVLEKLNTLIVIINPDGNVDYVSPSVQRLLGFKQNQLLGQGWWNLTKSNEEERMLVKDHITHLLNKNSGSLANSFERSLLSANGDNKWILWNTSIAADKSLVGIGYDITERKIAEEKLKVKNKELEVKNKEILQSIEYAKRIQEAILPDTNELNRYFNDAFVLYQPKDVVSGDFYWFFKKGNKTFVAALDCTGHGVPGALMSVIGNSIIKDVIVKKGIEDPAEILKEIDKELAIVLTKEGKNTADGMDIALCVFNEDEKNLLYAGAFRPLIKIRDSVAEEFKGSRYPIGFYSHVEKKFETLVIPYEKDDSFYIFTDGYIDQFGGEYGKKLNRKRFVELLLQIQSMNFEEQESFLEYAFRNWKQDELQTDDILVIGLKM